MTDIFWHDLNWMHVLLLIWHPYMPSDCNCLSPLNLGCITWLESRSNTAHHHDYSLLCNWTLNICTMSMQSWPGLHRTVIWNMAYGTASVRHTVRENFINCWILLYMSHIAALRRTRRSCILKQAPIRAIPELCSHHFQISLALLGIQKWRHEFNNAITKRKTTNLISFCRNVASLGNVQLHPVHSLISPSRTCLLHYTSCTHPTRPQFFEI